MPECHQRQGRSYVSTGYATTRDLPFLLPVRKTAHGDKWLPLGRGGPAPRAVFFPLWHAASLSESLSEKKAGA